MDVSLRFWQLVYSLCFFIFERKECIRFRVAFLKANLVRFVLELINPKLDSVLNYFMQIIPKWVSLKKFMSSLNWICYIFHIDLLLAYEHERRDKVIPVVNNCCVCCTFHSRIC